MASTDWNGMRRSRARALNAGSAAVLALAGCGHSPQADQTPPPASLAAADPIVVAVAPGPQGVRVTARLGQPDLAGDSVRAASGALRQLDRAVQSGAKDLPPSARLLTLAVEGVDLDKLGNRKPAPLFEADFRLDDLRQADLKTMGPAAVFNLAAAVRVDPAGEGGLLGWCMRYAHVGGDVCDKAKNQIYP